MTPSLGLWHVHGRGVFVGRSTELDRLQALAQLAASGRPAAGVVIGEAGLGKTRLLAELAGTLETPCVHVHGYELSRAVPLSASTGLLHTLSGVSDAGRRLAGLLLGEGGAGSGLGTLRLFEAAFRCLSGLGPLALVVDDLQWADPETLSLLQYLVSAGGPADLPLLVVCAGRPAAEVSTFASDLGRMLDPDAFAELSLDPLARDEGIELVVGLAPTLGAARAEELWRQAQGSPFWLQSLAGRDSAGPAPAQPSPARLIRTHLAGLDADALRVFELLVVATVPLGLHDSAELLGWSSDRIRQAVAVLVDRALVAHDSGTVRVAHDLIREAAAAELPEAEQRSLHRTLAAWFEADADEDVRQLFRALQHRQAAGLTAVDLATRIARAPQRRLLGGEGLAVLGAVADRSDEPALQREVAALASELGEWEVALQRWSALADRPTDDPARARSALAAANAAFRLGRPDDLHDLVARARQHAAGDPVLGIEADAQEAQSLLWLENRPEQARPLVQRALRAAQDLVERPGDVAVLEDAQRDAYARALRGRLDAAIRQADAGTVAQCADLIRTVARDPAEALAAASDEVFSLLQFEGLPSPAEHRARRILEESRRRVLPSLEVEATHWVGWIDHYLGRLDEAAENLEQAVALAARVGPPRRFTVAQLQAIAHSIAASRGEWRGHVAEIERAIAAEPDPHFRIAIRVLHVWLVGRFASPRPEDLAGPIRAMAEDADRAGCGRCLWESVLYAAEAQARVGDLDAARAALDRWDSAHPQPRGGPAIRRVYVGALLEMHRDPAASLPAFARAASDATAARHELLRLWIDLDTAAAATRVDRTRGIEAWRAAAQSAASMGALSEQQLAVQQLRALGVRTWRRGSETSSLTAREQEIADRVAAGASNPEIASALFLSRKTVERHVSNILGKVGARNRTELAHRLGHPAAPDEGVPR